MDLSPLDEIQIVFEVVNRAPMTKAEAAVVTGYFRREGARLVAEAEAAAKASEVPPAPTLPACEETPSTTEE